MIRRTTIAITSLSVTLLGTLFLASCGGPAPGRSEEALAAGQAQGVSVAAYCEAFARQYALRHDLAYSQDSARTEAKSDFMRRLSNVFQPSDSKFTGGYACRFAAGAGGDTVSDFAVDIVLTNTREFAEHTQWERLQLVPIAHVVDEARDRSGYGVFKYLDAPALADTVGAAASDRRRAIPRKHSS